MKRVLLLAACAAFLPGCLASFGLQVGNTGVPATQPSVGPGGSFSTGGVSARISDGPALGALIGVGVLSALFGGEQRRPPELDASRRVHEQDCTKVLEDPSANLRCR
jgi:hypothetical protein